MSGYLKMKYKFMDGEEKAIIQSLIRKDKKFFPDNKLNF